MTVFKPNPLQSCTPKVGAAADESAHGEALAFLYDRINYEGAAATSSKYPFRLGRMAELVERLGLGHTLFPTPASGQRAGGVPPKPLIHIAGTKGKGSTAAMAASILTAAGYRTGLYTSPHLNELEERFRINSTPCPQQTFIELVNEIRPIVQAMDVEPGLEPTFFELATALAMLYFDKQACDVIVLEVGLGGRLDSTNVFASSVAVITSIGLDHQNVLGETIEQIAAEKAGIIKGGAPVVSTVLRPEAAQVIAQKATANQSILYQRGRDFEVDATMANSWGSEMIFKSCTPPLHASQYATLTLEGSHQPGNAAAAIAAVDLIASSTHLSISDASICNGLANVSCTARIERFDLQRGVTGILDAAHNEDSISALVSALKSRFANRSITIVFGTSRDKKADRMLGLLMPIADSLFLTRYRGNPRFRDPEELRLMLPPSFCQKVKVIRDPVAACDEAMSQTKNGDVLVICGSFFLAAETRQWMQSSSHVS